MRPVKRFKRPFEKIALAPEMAVIGAQTPSDLIKICGDPQRKTEDRELGCFLLGQMRFREAVPVLLEVASSSNQLKLFWAALSAIGSIASRRATRPIHQILNTTNIPAKRQAAVFALSLLQDKRSQRTLIRVLVDKGEDDCTRDLAAEALGSLVLNHQISKVLIEALKDSSPRVRYGALCGIGALRDKTAKDAVRSLFEDQAILEGEGSVADRAKLVEADL